MSAREECKYADSDGRECSLDVMCMREPGWAANRIRAEIERAERAEAAVERIRGEMQDRLDHERIEHDETRGYRQHAEQTVAELRTQRDALAEALRPFAGLRSGVLKALCDLGAAGGEGGGDG